MKLIQEKQGVQSPYQPKEAVDPLDPSKGVVDKASIDGINTIMLPFNLKDRETDDHYGTPSGTPEEVDELLRRGWAHTPWDSDSVIEKWGAVQDPSGEWMLPTKEGTLRNATDEEKLMIESDFQHREENNLYDGHEHQEVAGNPFGYSDEFIHRSKALQDIINGRGYDPDTVIEAQKQWIKLQRMGDIWKRVDASDLTNTLKDKQNPRTGSLNHLPEEERKELLIRGVAAHKA